MLKDIWDARVPDGVGVLIILAWALVWVTLFLRTQLIPVTEPVRENICKYYWNPADAKEDPWKCEKIGDK